ncbi:unnamed protein product, partial [Vitis vinifera]
MERRRHEHDFEEEWREAGISRGYSYTDYNVNGRNIERIVEPETVEQVFKNLEVPSWRKQITIRAMVTSIVLSFVFNFVICKLSLTTGIIPSFNVAAGLLGFAFVKAWVSLIEKFGLLKQPFTRQENTVIQTCVVAASGIAFNNGTSSYLLAMSSIVADQADRDIPTNVKSLSLGWIIGFLLTVSFVGLFLMVPLTEMMIIKYKLTYPTGTATAYLINSFHTPRGAKLAGQQVSALFKSFCFSFAFAFFQWFFRSGSDCGFSSFPTFGLQAYSHRFYFDFSSTYVGVGMICPYMVNVSLLLGSILSWGIMWPLIEKKAGIWYSADLPANSLHGIQGYRVFLAIAMMLGDGLYHVAYIMVKTMVNIIQQHSMKRKEATERTSRRDISRLHPLALCSSAKFIPSPMCIAIPFYLGGYFSIDMCIGSLILLFWGMKNKQMANDFGPAVASGLICGESLWGVPAAMLSLAGLNAPICMKFLSASTNNKIDAILSALNSLANIFPKMTIFSIYSLAKKHKNRYL